MMTYFIAIIRAKACNYLLGPFMITCSMFLISAQTPVITEYQVKAAFIFNFTQFVDWPPASFTSEESPIIIGILGNNPFDSYVENIVAGEKSNGHPLVVYHYKNPDEIKTCHVLFISKTEINNLSTILARLKGKNILTVSDAPNFLEVGGMIKFFTKDNKINLQINPDKARADGLVISSKLLRLAEISVPE